MKKLACLFTMILMLWQTGAFANVEYGIFAIGGGWYQVRARSDVAYIGNPANQIGNSQVTIKYPSGTASIANLTNDNFVWVQDVTVDFQTDDPGWTYISFGTTGGNLDMPANTEVNLLRFQNTLTCTDIIALINHTTDLYYINSLTPLGNSVGNNPGNSYYQLTQGDVYHNNYVTEAPCFGEISDLSLTKTANVAEVNVGQQIVYTLTLSNAGPVTAATITVSDLLPAGVTFVSASGGGSYNSSTGVWTVTALASGSSAALQITVQAAQAGTVVNTAQVISSSQPDPDSTPNNNLPGEDDQASVTVTVNAPPQNSDLSLTKTANVTQVNVGQQIVYTLTLSNAGPATAATVTISDLLPAGVTFVSASSGSYNSSTGLWTVTALASGSSAALQITVQAAQAGTVVNTAQVISSSQPDPDSTPNNNVPGEDDQASVSVTIQGPPQESDLSLTKTANVTQVNVGQQIVYTLTLSNAGPATAATVTISDLLPAGVTFVSASSGSYNSSTGVWTVTALASGSSATLQITVQAAQAGTVVNTAQVISSSQSDPDSTPNNNIPGEDDQASVSVTIQGPPQESDLSLTKTANVTQVNVGQQIVYTLTLSNAGPATAATVTISDLLPAGVTFVSSSGGSYNSSTGVWTVTALASGSSAALQITVLAAQAGTVVNTAQVISSSQPDPDSTPNNNVPGEDDQASVSVTIQGPPQESDLSLTKTANVTQVNVGQQIVYTLTLSNAGPATAATVTISDLLPAGVTFVSASGSGSYNSSTGLWTVTALASGSSAALQITVLAAQAGTVVNTAQVISSSQPDPDSTPNNNIPGEDDQASVSVTIQGPPQNSDLSLTKTANVTQVNVGQQIVYTLTLSNAGPATAATVTISDLLPAGVTFVSASSGSYNSSTGVWTVTALASGSSAALQITVQAAQAGTVVNTAQVISSSQPDPDSTPNNNIPGEDDQASVSVTIQGPPQNSDLSMTKTANVTQVNVGQQIVYTLTLSNAGPATAATIAVSDMLPAGVTFVSASGSGSYNSSTGLWTVTSLAAGANAALQITVQAAQAGTVVNTAQVISSSQPDPDSTPNNNIPGEDDQASVSVTVVAPVQDADLSMIKTANKSQVNKGEQIVYTLTISNAGPATATGVTVSDILPARVTFVSASGSGSYNSSTGIWTVPGINSGSSFSLQITVVVNDIGMITNMAQVRSSDQRDPDSTPNNNNASEDDQSSVSVNALVPVELSSFSCQLSGDKVMLTWITQSETENLGFEIHRSSAAEGPYSIVSESMIKGAGSSTREHSYSWLDANVETGRKYYYKLSDISLDGIVSFYGPIDIEVAVPNSLVLEQNYPNPFNPYTNITFSLDRASSIDLNIYSVRGELVKTLISGEVKAGIHSVAWDGRDEAGSVVANGTYFYRLSSEGKVMIKSMLFLK